MPYGRIDATKGINAGETFYIGPGEQRTIGRIQGNDLVFAEPSVSSKQCRVVAHPDGFVLEDVGSRNGTLVNGEKVESMILEDGDVIRFGRSELTFRLYESEEEARGGEQLESRPKEKVGFETQAFEPIDKTVREDPSRPEPTPAELNMLGRILIYNGMITELQLNMCLKEMADRPGVRLGELLVERGYLTETDLALALRIQTGAKRNIANEDDEKVRADNLIEVAIKKGFLKPEQVKHARKLQEKSIKAGLHIELHEVLLKKNYLKRQQYQEILAQQGPDGLGVDIPGYDDYELLGYGGMGAVYKARQVSMDRPVAIKVLAARLRDKEKYRERFLKEARNVAKLNHENIIAGYDFGESDSVSYFVMEYVEGKTCEELLAESGSVEERECAEIILQTCRALQHADEKGMVHRDIKPENIMLTDEDRKVKLCDLGLAWNVDEFDEGSKGFGTPNYMSPEQIRGQALDVRTDIYSLGVTFYRLLFGKLPFYGNSPAVTMSMHLKDPVRFPDATMSPLQRALSNVIVRMMAKQADQRYQTPEDCAKELEGILEKYTGDPDETPPAGNRPPARGVSASTPTSSTASGRGSAPKRPRRGIARRRRRRR